MSETMAATAMSPTARRGASRQERPSRWRSWYSRYGALAGYTATAVVIYFGWIGRAGWNIDAKYGLGYWLGIVGGVLMLILLLYSVRKRVPMLRHFGASQHWFRWHMILGIGGPVLILFHCNFKLGDLNSRVALYCTLLVAGSGVVGRYLYAGFHQGLYGRRASLRELAERLKRAPSATGPASTLLAELRDDLAQIDKQVLEPAHNVLATIFRPIWISWATRVRYYKLRSLVRRKLVAHAATSNVVDQHAERLEDAIRRYLRQHLAQVRQVAHFSAYERLFAIWHVIHIPFFMMLVLSAIVHIIAVHLY